MLQYVANRDAATLMPIIIQRWIQPGTTVHSDMWAAYQQLANHGYQHGTVNHTVQFVNNGITTNHVESFWSRVKRRLKYIYGSSGELQWSHLDEAQYRLWFGWTNASVFANWQVFSHHVSALYP
jgi:hypothetical protein